MRLRLAYFSLLMATLHATSSPFAQPVPLYEGYILTMPVRLELEGESYDTRELLSCLPNNARDNSKQRYLFSHDMKARMVMEDRDGDYRVFLHEYANESHRLRTEKNTAVVLNDRVFFYAGMYGMPEIVGIDGRTIRQFPEDINRVFHLVVPELFLYMQDGCPPVLADLDGNPVKEFNRPVSYCIPSPDGQFLLFNCDPTQPPDSELRNQASHDRSGPWLYSVNSGSVDSVFVGDSREQRPLRQYLVELSGQPTIVFSSYKNTSSHTGQFCLGTVSFPEKVVQTIKLPVMAKALYCNLTSVATDIGGNRLLVTLRGYLQSDPGTLATLFLELNSDGTIVKDVELLYSSSERGPMGQGGIAGAFLVAIDSTGMVRIYPW